MVQKRRQIPIEKRDYSRYYIIFSGLLFLGTMWAVVDEVSTRRPWKDHQKEYLALAEVKIQARLDQAIAEVDSFTLEELTEELQVAQDSMTSATYTNAMAQYNSTLEELVDVRREYQFAKSRADEAYYFYKKSVKEGAEDLDEKAKLEEHEADVEKYQTVITALEEKRDSILFFLNTYRLRVKDVQKEISDLLEDVEKWQMKKRRIEAAPIEIKQVMMLDYDRNPFNDPKARVDRCQTCHLGWNEDVMQDAPQPYTKHPVPELLSIHTPEQYGCTPCHRGQGPALTAGFAHGDEDHYWESPLYEAQEVYASCNECHENQSSLKHAPAFTKAKRLMIESGCHGCHEIKRYTELPKIGPELNRLGFKTTANWIFRWVKNPKGYNPHTRMPNNGLNDEQAEAVAAYLLNVSSKNPFEYSKGSYVGGDADRGKLVFESVGCQACHVVGDNTAVREDRGTSYDIAPELTRVGSKVNPDWVYDWIRNPRHYNPTTRMPSLRLTEREAKDVVSYLMTLQDPREFQQESLDLTSAERIRRGESVIREYGCHGCHAIQGFEKEARVSVALSNFGRKKVEEMDFGDTKIPHTWHDWITNKLRNSRFFETDRIVQKMPVYAFNEEEVALLRMFLLSETKDAPDEKYVQAFSLKQQNIEAGRRLAINYNCQQCHMLEEEGAHIGAILEDVAFLPPPITGEGKKVQEPWLHDFLQNPSEIGRPNSIRPWIKTRMPTFDLTDAEINTLMKYFLGLSDQVLQIRDYEAYRPNPELLPVGEEIFTLFQCANCHPSRDVIPGQGGVTTADLAPKLELARGRLKPEWIVEWLADPGKLQPGTRMPTYFPDGESPLPDVLDGDAKKQMMAIRDHVISLGRPARSMLSSR